MEDLKDEGYYLGQELPGKIIIVESLNPANKKDLTRNLKTAGNTGVVCKVNGEPIYRKTIYSIVSNASDQLVKHDNVDEIKAANNIATVKVSKLKSDPANEFNI